MYAYIIKSIKTYKYYIGHCRDVNQRLQWHNQGRSKSTKNGIPWIIIHAEEFATRADAARREKKIKSYKGGNAFKRLIGDVATASGGTTNE